MCVLFSWKKNDCKSNTFLVPSPCTGCCEKLCCFSSRCLGIVFLLHFFLLQFLKLRKSSSCEDRTLCSLVLSQVHISWLSWMLHPSLSSGALEKWFLAGICAPLRRLSLSRVVRRLLSTHPTERGQKRHRNFGNVAGIVRRRRNVVEVEDNAPSSLWFPRWNLPEQKSISSANVFFRGRVLVRSVARKTPICSTSYKINVRQNFKYQVHHDIEQNITFCHINLLVLIKTTPNRKLHVKQHDLDVEMLKIYFISLSFWCKRGFENQTLHVCVSS